MKKFLLISLLSVSLVTGFVYYIFYLSPSDNFRPIYLVPDNAVYIIHSEEPIKSWKKVSSSSIWKHMQKQPYFAELTRSANSLDSIIHNNETLFELLGSRSITVSAHVYAPRKYDFLFIADLEKASKLKFVQDYFTNLGGEGFTITERAYHNHRIYEFYDKVDRSTLHLTFIKNLVVCSYVGQLVEASIDQQEEPVIGRCVRFIEMKQEISKEGLFNIYIQYTRLGDFLGCYLAGEDEYVKELSEAVYYTGLNVNLQDDSHFITSGYTNINDTASSYLKAMILSGKGQIGAPEVIPQRVSYYLSLAVDDFDDFYERFINLLKEKPLEYQEYQDNISRIEKFLKIDVKEHFISWIGDEIAFVQTQPKIAGQENEFSVIIKSNGGKDASENLNYISKQIRKKTPVKFKEISYNGYPINYLSIKGMFRLVLGNFFEKLDKPYYTIIDDYVIFSNHPQTLKNLIDDYRAGGTLSRSVEFADFLDLFDKSSNVFIYVQPPLLYKGLQGFVSQETWVSIGDNKDYITCFPHVAFQMNEKKGMFETKFISSFAKPKKESIFFQANNQIKVPIRPADEIEDDEESDEIYLKDLDAKKYIETYENGSLKLKVNIKNGIRHGSYSEYYPEGLVKVKGRYRNDLKDGTFKFYDENGKLIEKKSFSKGEEVF